MGIWLFCSPYSLLCQSFSDGKEEEEGETAVLLTSIGTDVFPAVSGSFVKLVVPSRLEGGDNGMSCAAASGDPRVNFERGGWFDCPPTPWGLSLVATLVALFSRFSRIFFSLSLKSDVVTRLAPADPFPARPAEESL